MSQNDIQLYKTLYPKGTRIEVISMAKGYESLNGVKGTVDHVDDVGTVHCTFDNDRTLGLIPSEDIFRKVW